MLPGSLPRGCRTRRSPSGSCCSPPPCAATSAASWPNSTCATASKSPSPGTRAVVEMCCVLVAGDILRGRGHVVAGGGIRRRRGRESCPRTRGLSPAGADRTPPRGMSRWHLGCGRLRPPRKRAIRASPAGPRWGGAREPGRKTWDARGAHPRKILTSDKPDLFLVHLRSVQGSGILRGNRSTSYSRRRISDRSGRPSVAVHQSNRQGRSRAPSSGQVRDDVPRGDHGASGR